MAQVLYRNVLYPWLELYYNENLSQRATDTLSEQHVNYVIPEAVRHPGVVQTHLGDLVSPLMFWKGTPVDLRGVQTNARKY